jgi:hypothetical protein
MASQIDHRHHAKPSVALNQACSSEARGFGKMEKDRNEALVSVSVLQAQIASLKLVIDEMRTSLQRLSQQLLTPVSAPAPLPAATPAIATPAVSATASVASVSAAVAPTVYAILEDVPDLMVVHGDSGKRQAGEKDGQNAAKKRRSDVSSAALEDSDADTAEHKTASAPPSAVAERTVINAKRAPTKQLIALVSTKGAFGSRGAAAAAAALTTASATTSAGSLPSSSSAPLV